MLAVTKDPYVLDFIDITEDAKERDLESALVREIPRFLRQHEGDRASRLPFPEA